MVKKKDAVTQEKVVRCHAFSEFTKAYKTEITKASKMESIVIDKTLVHYLIAVQNGQLCAVIDFGQLAVGDPACDLAIAWTSFQGKNRKIFRTLLSSDADTWACLDFMGPV